MRINIRDRAAGAARRRRLLRLLLAAVPALDGRASEEPAAPPQQGQPAPEPGPAQPETALPRETAIENPLGSAPAVAGSAFGGYGELTLNAPSNAPAVIDLRRFVLFFGHDFTDRIRFYSEVEVEHAVSSADDRGEVEIEQAFLDGLLEKRLNLRGGLVIMPVGIVNVYHEPPSFNGVDRPDVDTFVIPSTWREPALGIFGELAEGLRYQLYLVNGFNANGFTAEFAIREGHQEAQLAQAGDYGAVLRVDWEPLLGTVMGVSGYAASSRNTPAADSGAPPSAIGRIPLALVEADVRTRWHGFSARAEVAVLFIGKAAALTAELDPAAGPISSQSRGAYAEVAYDLLRLVAPSTAQTLTAFARFDYADTQAAVPAGLQPRLEFRRYSEVAGLVYRPIPQIALKADFRLRQYGAGPDTHEAASAVTWLF